MSKQSGPIRIQLLCLKPNGGYRRCAIARCRLRLSDFRLCLRGCQLESRKIIVFGSHQACLMACVKDPGSDWRRLCCWQSRFVVNNKHESEQQMKGHAESLQHIAWQELMVVVILSCFGAGTTGTGISQITKVGSEGRTGFCQVLACVEQSQYIFGVQHSSRQFHFFVTRDHATAANAQPQGYRALRQLPFWNKAHSREVVQAHVIPVLIVIKKEHSENANACQFPGGLYHYFSGTTQQVISEGGVQYLLEPTTWMTSLKQSCCSTILGLLNRITRWSLVNYLIQKQNTQLGVVSVVRPRIFLVWHRNSILPSCHTRCFSA